jgi:hypothetical protein
LKVPPRDHPMYGLTFGEKGQGSVIEHISELQPYFWMCEQTSAFDHRDPSDRAQRSHLAQFLERVKLITLRGSQAYSVKVVRMLGSLWIKGLERDRRAVLL